MHSSSGLPIACSEDRRNEQPRSQPLSIAGWDSGTRWPRRMASPAALTGPDHGAAAHREEYGQSRNPVGRAAASPPGARRTCGGGRRPASMNDAGIPVPRSGQGDMPGEKERHPASEADARHPLRRMGQASKVVILVSGGGKPCPATFN